MNFLCVHSREVIGTGQMSQQVELSFSARTLHEGFGHMGDRQDYKTFFDLFRPMETCLHCWALVLN